MASRTIYAGDNDPPVRLQLTDEGAVMDLSTATSVEVLFIGPSEFSGPGAPINVVDPDGKHTWNLEYTFAVGDTDGPGTFKIFVVVTTSDGVKTFDTGDTLVIKALPAVSG